jgi:hypothetical protein
MVFTKENLSFPHPTLTRCESFGTFSNVDRNTPSHKLRSVFGEQEAIGALLTISKLENMILLKFGRNMLEKAYEEGMLAKQNTNHL